VYDVFDAAAASLVTRRERIFYGMVPATYPTTDQQAGCKRKIRGSDAAQGRIIRLTKGQRNEAKMNVELSPIVLSPLYAKRAQKPDEANPMSS
jgi:hypothetical protein